MTRERTFKWLDETYLLISNIKDEETKVFIRGQSRHEKWSLIPKIARPNYWPAKFSEGNIFHDFSIRSKLLFKDENSWEVLCRMQHYGLPTRLLDWTESFHVALFFAVGDEKHDKEDGVIWVLNPFRLNNVYSGKLEIEILGASENYDYGSNFLETDKTKIKTGWAEKKIASVLPPHTNSRLLAQQGVFTLHEDLTKSLEQLHEEDLSSKKTELKYLEKIILPSELKSELREYLVLSGVSEYSLFPDIEGLSRYLNKIYSSNADPENLYIEKGEK